MVNNLFVNKQFSNAALTTLNHFVVTELGIYFIVVTNVTKSNQSPLQQNKLEL